MEIKKRPNQNIGACTAMKTVWITEETHAKVKQLALETNRPMIELFSLLIDFALGNVEVKE